MLKILALLMLAAAAPGIANAQTDAMSDAAKSTVIRLNQYDETDLHWAKLPGDQIKGFLAAYDDFVRSGNNPECYIALSTGGNEESHEGRSYSNVMYVDFVTKAAYRAVRGNPPLKSDAGCGQPMHYSISDDGRLIRKYKPK